MRLGFGEDPHHFVVRKHTKERLWAMHSIVGPVDAAYMHQARLAVSEKPQCYSSMSLHQETRPSSKGLLAKDTQPGNSAITSALTQHNASNPAAKGVVRPHGA